ncbi:thiamine pyrophosphate-binding protein, partial [Kaarinaea lacus]
MSAATVTKQKSNSLANINDNVFDASDLITYFLEQIGVEYIFGIPGGAIEPLYNAMARSSRRDGLRPIVTRHETGAAFMADGYAQQTGKLGVCCATTGPGATNLITGVADAYENNVPLLVLTAQTPLPTFGKGAFQESSCTGVDTVGMFAHCTRYNSLVSHVDQLQHKLVAAIMTAHKAPKGPVHLSIPLDVLREKVKLSNTAFDLKRLLRQTSSFDYTAINELYEEIDNAKNIVLVLGGGCGVAMGSICKFADTFNASIITTPHGKGLINANHPRYRGVIGFAGHQSALATLNDPEVDLVIAVETNFSEWASCGWDEHSLLNERLIHIDSVEENLTRSPMARLHATGNVLTIFEQLTRIANKRSGGRKKIVPCIATAKTNSSFRLDEEEKYHSDATPIKPQRLMHELNKRFPVNTRFFADTGNSVAWAVHYLQPLDRRTNTAREVNNGLFRTSIEFSSMGWAIGAAIGAAMGCNKGPIVCITGDGSFLMNGSELTVAVAEQLSVIFVVLNDASLGMVKHG